MSLSITVGTVTITINAAAAADPVVTHPGNAPATYSAFAEAVGGVAGLARTVFDAFPSVAQFNNSSNARVKWPPFYGTTTRPWGQPADPVTGYREVQCIDDPPDSRWTDNVHNAASGRKSYLESLAETAVAIAAGIKSAIEGNFQIGHATLGAGGFVDITTARITASSEFFVTRRTAVSTAEVSVAGASPGDPGSFRIQSGDPGDLSTISWMVVG